MARFEFIGGRAHVSLDGQDISHLVKEINMEMVRRSVMVRRQQAEEQDADFLRSVGISPEGVTRG